MRRRTLGELLALGALAVLVLSWVPWPSAMDEVVLCPLRRWTGIPCPGCGLTRSFRCLSHAEFGRAFELNPFGHVLYPLTLVLASSLLWGRFIPVWEERLWRSRALAWTTITLVSSMSAFGIWRVWRHLSG